MKIDHAEIIQTRDYEISTDPGPSEDVLKNFISILQGCLLTLWTYFIGLLLRSRQNEHESKVNISRIVCSVCLCVLQ